MLHERMDLIVDLPSLSFIAGFAVQVLSGLEFGDNIEAFSCGGPWWVDIFDI